MSYGGLRGAVGIALALSLHAEVYHLTTDIQFQGDTAKLFGMVGGIALLTLGKMNQHIFIGTLKLSCLLYSVEIGDNPFCLSMIKQK